MTQAWLTFSSVVLAFTFIFGNFIRTVGGAALCCAVLCVLRVLCCTCAVP